MGLGHPATNVQSTHAAMARIWLFLTTIGFSTLTSSPIECAPGLVERNPKIGRSGNIAAQENEVWKLSNQREAQNGLSNSILTDIDSSAIHLAMQQKNRPSYFWIENLYNHKADEKTTKLDLMGKKIDENDRSGIVQSLRKEYLLLKKKLWSCRAKLGGIQLPRKTKNAYGILEDYLENHTIMIFGCLIDKNQLSPEKEGSIQKTPGDMKWKLLTHHFQNQLFEIEDILLELKLKNQDTKYEKEGKSTFIVQLFNILNCLVKYKLIGESYFRSWINKHEVLSLLADHISKCMDEISMFFVTDIREGLYKSKMSQHLVLSLDYLSEKGWRLIEFKNLFKKTDYLSNLETREKPHEHIIRLSKTLQNVLNVEGEDENSTPEMNELIVEMINYFERTPYYRRRTKNYHTYGLVYQMVHFIMRYYPYHLKEALKDEDHAMVFSLKVHVLELSLNVLRSARAVHFVGKFGYWTTEVDSRNSEHLVSLKQVQNWRHVYRKFVSDIENRYFREVFSGHLPGERTRMIGKWRELSVAKNTSECKGTICVNDFYENKKLPEKFGANFSLHIPRRKNKAHKQSQNTAEKKISGLFLKESYAWMQNMEFVLTKFRNNQDAYCDIIKGFLYYHQGTIPQKVKEWITDFQMIRTVHTEINHSLSKAELLWDKIQKRLGLINQVILELSTTQYPPKQNPEPSKQGDGSGSDAFGGSIKINPPKDLRINSQFKNLLPIPKADFSINATIKFLQ